MSVKFFKQLHWLEIAEYVAIAMTLISLLIALATNILWLPLIFLTIVGILNLINRLRFQYLIRKRIARAIEQFQQQLLAINHTQGIPHASSPIEEIEAQKITSLENNLTYLEQALNNIIQYLNKSALLERLEHLEKSYAQLKKEKLYPSDSADPPESSIASPNLPTVHLSQPSPSPNIPNWNYCYTLHQGQGAIASLAISADGKWLASVGWDRSLNLWDIATGNLIDIAIAHNQGILAVVFTNNETTTPYTLATGSFDQTIQLWSFSPDSSPHLAASEILTAHTGSIHALAYAPQPHILVSGSYDCTIKQWDIASGELLHSSYDQLGAIYAIALHQERQIIASGGGDGRISLWQLGSGDNLGLLGGNVSSIESLAISPDGHTLAAGCVDGKIKLWQLDHLSEPIAMLAAHTGQVKGLKFTQDGQTLLSSGADGSIKIWHSGSSEALALLSVDDEATAKVSSVSSLALSLDGQWLVAGRTDGTLNIWQQK